MANQSPERLSDTLQVPAMAQPHSASPAPQQTSAKQAHRLQKAQPPSSAKKPRHGETQGLDPVSPKNMGDHQDVPQSCQAQASALEDGSQPSKRQRLGASPEGQGRPVELPGDALPLPLDPPELLKRPSAHAVRWSQNQLDTHLQTVLTVVKVSCVMPVWCLVSQ